MSRFRSFLSDRYVLASVVSGTLWASVAVWLGISWLPDAAWGGIVASPWIGLAVGAAFRSVYRRSWTTRILMPLASVYAGGALFGLAVGIAHAGSQPDLLSHLGRHLAAIPVGLTLSGYALALWPLSFANHELLARWAERGRSGAGDDPLSGLAEDELG